MIKKTSGRKALLPDLLNALSYLTGFGSKPFSEKMKKALGYRAKGRKIISADDIFELREAITPFGKADTLDSGNTYLWNQQPPSLIGQFLHENWSIKTEILLFLGIFYHFFNMLLWPDPRAYQNIPDGFDHCGHAKLLSWRIVENFPVVYFKDYLRHQPPWDSWVFGIFW